MSRTILIVDDNPINIDVLIKLLHDYDIVTALDGKSAIEILQNDEIDLILLDIMMPQLDGFEVCKILKRSATTKDIPIIFLSAKNSYDDIKYGFELGALDYITKPFNPSELLARVRTHVELRAYQKSLQKQVSDEVEKNRQKDYLLFQQSKQAAFGELLMHIAHQWKQPLSELNSINMLNLVKLKKGISIEDDEYLKSFEQSQNIISFMSETIETFKNFYKPTNLQNSFYLIEVLESVLSIIDATFNFENIKVEIDNNESKQSYANINEISQVIFSILNNAKETFKQRDIQSPKIDIVIKDHKIVFKDNAGGIDNSIIDNIFLPFFSSNKSSGVGLYLSKTIMEKNDGYIKAANNKNGATFEIGFN